MIDKYDSTDFWYTYLKSLKNLGQLGGSEELEMDSNVQEKLLAYIKTKIEENISEEETALPPGLHDYISRFPKDMLSKLRTLAESSLETGPNNGAAVILLAIVVYGESDSEYESHVEKAMMLAPKDPCMNLHLLRARYTPSGHAHGEERVLTALENLFKWAKQQDDSPRYQEVKSCYKKDGITPYSVYKMLKFAQWKHVRIPYSPYERVRKSLYENPALYISSEGPSISIGLSVPEQIMKCRALMPEEQAAFQKELGQESDDQQDLGKATSENTDFWDAYFNSLENRGLSFPRKRLTQKDQDQLLEYFKTKIKVGVVDGKTTLPAQLQEYIPYFPEAIRLELREFSEEVLETQPDNGAAANMLAITVWEDGLAFGIETNISLLLLEQAMKLTPNDPETCLFAISLYYEYLDPLSELTLTALERLFERAKQQSETELYYWLCRLYREVGRTPCYVYRKLMKNPDGNAELIARCQPLLTEMQHAFEQQLVIEPDDWYALRGLGDIYETLGETELAKKYPWAGHTDLKTKWEQAAWVERQLPNFSAVSLDGTPISFSDYRGKIVLLNFFCAKWCASEIPYIKEAYKNYHKDGFDVIGVSLDENEAELREFIDAHDIPWLQIYDGKGWKSELARYFGINSVPSQWLIDRDGKFLSLSTRGEKLGQLLKWTETTRVGNIVQDFSAVDVDGNEVSLSAYRGKVVLLYFSHPEQELRYVDTIYHKYHQKGFEFICVGIGAWGDEEKLRHRVSEKNYQGHHIYDDANGGRWGPMAQQFGIQDVPALVLIDTDGKVIEARTGKVYSSEAWSARLEKLVAAHLGLR